MLILGSMIAPLTVLLTAFLAGLPWGVGSEYRFVLPHLTFAVVHYWASRRPHSVPEWIVFAAGLMLDVMTGGPLGFWALVLLAGYVVAVLQSERGEDTLRRWLQFALALGGLAVFEWLVASLYYLEWSDWRPFLAAALLVMVLYPLIALVLGILHPLGVAPRRQIAGEGR